MTILMLLLILFQLLSRKFPLPEGQTVLTEGQLNQYTREYLQILVNKKLLVRFKVVWRRTLEREVKFLHLSKVIALAIHFFITAPLST